MDSFAEMQADEHLKSKDYEVGSLNTFLLKQARFWVSLNMMPHLEARLI